MSTLEASELPAFEEVEVEIPEIEATFTDDFRNRVHRTLQSLVEEDNDLDKSYLVRWALIMDWLNENDDHVAVRMGSHKNMPYWERTALFEHAATDWG